MMLEIAANMEVVVGRCRQLLQRAARDNRASLLNKRKSAVFHDEPKVLVFKNSFLVSIDGREGR